MTETSSPRGAGGISRRRIVQSGAALLATVAVAQFHGEVAAVAAPMPRTPGASSTNLAAYRPVTASSTAYAPTPASFVTDAFAETGVRGSGWRAAANADGQWIAVDLQATCTVQRITLVFEAALTDPPFDGNYGQTYGTEILSSAASAFSIQTSTDGKTWTTAYSTTQGPGAVTNVVLPKPVAARWVRMVETARSNTNPVGLNSFEVYGTTTARRPAVTGWTQWQPFRAPATALRVAADGTAPLDGTWELTVDAFAGTDDGTTVSTTGSLRDSSWLRAEVPTTVHAALVAAGKLPDPVAGFANLEAPEALSRHDWWFRRDFTVPRELDTSSGRHLWLEFDGLTQSADVYLDGTSLGSVANPFTRGRFDVASIVRKNRSTHTVAVRAKPMPHPGTPGDKSSDGNTFVQGGHLYLDSPTYLAASGWDWMPAVRDRGTGIWDHVRLRSTGHAVIGDALVQTKLPNLPKLDAAAVTVTVPVRNASANTITTTVKIQLDAVRASKTVTIPGNREVDVVFAPADTPSLQLRHPDLWWPNGYGAPTLHDLVVTTSIGGTTSDRRSISVGLRQFDYAWNQPIVVPPATTPRFIVQQGSDQPGQIVSFTKTTAKYVRLLLDTRATGYGFSIWRFAVLAGADSATDLAQLKTATASSTGETWGTPDKAVDGDPNTRWTSAYADGQWLQVDLGSVTAFDTVEVAWENAYAATYDVQTSDDGNTWTTVEHVDNTGVYGDSFVQTEQFAAQTARWMRIQGGARATGYGISIWRLSVTDSASPGTDLALGKAAAASSDDGNPASNATDGNPRTRWSSAYQDNQWIQVDLGLPVRFDGIAIDWEQAYARDYAVQVSDDGSTWRTVLDVDNRITQLTISVNGTKVFCRGGNWGWDELLRRVDAGDPAGRLETAVRMHRDMNFTMIRNWLGSSDRDELFALCDKYGLLLWNDFWEAGQFQDDIRGYVDTVTETIRRYRHHASVIIWCGANEEVPPANLNAGMAQSVKDNDPDKLYVPDSASGVVSGHGPYRWLEPTQYNDRSTYDTDAFGFHTEIGMPVIPVTETMQHLVGDQPGWPISEVWNYHDWSETANQQTGGYKAAIEQRLGAASTLDQFASRAQFVNYENHRAMFEAWNDNLWNDATALLLWMSHPAWYSTVWQTYDYDLDVNGAYYGARAGCEPLHVQARPTDWQIVVANHTAQDRRGMTVTADIYDLQGKRLGEARRAKLDVTASSITRSFMVEVPPKAPSLHLVRLTLSDRSGVLSTNTYWRYTEPADMQALTTGPKTTLRIRTSPAGHTRNGRRTMRVTVLNQGRAVASMTRLSVVDVLGRRILPATYSDNYVWLLPGEQRQIDVTYPADKVAVRVRAKAYNSPTAAG